MESAYTLAGRELARRREENRKEHDRRRKKVLAAAPAMAELEQKLALGGTALIKCVMDKKTDISAIEARIRQLQQKKRALLCALHLPDDYLDDIYTCPHCHDTGFDQNGRRCSCYLQLISKYIGANANLTEYMKEQTFDRFDYRLFQNQPAQNGRQPLAYIKAAVQKAMHFAETFDTTHQNLLLMGNAGTGKTYLSSCIANYALGRGKSVYYQTAFSLFDTMEKLKFDRLSGEDEEQAAAATKHAHKVELLIIDDLGTEFVSAYSSAALFELLNERLMQKRSTILSTNFSLNNLENIYGRRVLSRLYGYFEILPFVGRDLRIPQKHEEES